MNQEFVEAASRWSPRVLTDLLDARITDIAEEAGAAHGTFYTYFDSKESALRGANRWYLETYRANSKLMVIWENAAAVRPDMADLLHEATAAFVTEAEKTIRGLQEAGLADPSLDPRYAAPALTGMVSRFAYTWCTEGKDFALDKACRRADRPVGLGDRPAGKDGRVSRICGGRVVIITGPAGGRTRCSPVRHRSPAPRPPWPTAWL